MGPILLFFIRLPQSHFFTPPRLPLLRGGFVQLKHCLHFYPLLYRECAKSKCHSRVPPYGIPLCGKSGNPRREILDPRLKHSGMTKTSRRDHFHLTQSLQGGIGEVIYFFILTELSQQSIILLTRVYPGIFRDTPAHTMKIPRGFYWPALWGEFYYCKIRDYRIRL